MKDMVNFRVNKELKDSFKDICRLGNNNMSYVIIRFMKEYINNEGLKIKNEMKNINEIRIEMERVKDKISSDKVYDSRLDKFSF